MSDGFEREFLMFFSLKVVWPLMATAGGYVNFAHFLLYLQMYTVLFTANFLETSCFDLSERFSRFATWKF